MSRLEQTVSDERKELGESVEQSLRDANIGSRYAHPSKTLATHGAIGKKVSNDFKSGELSQLAKGGFGVYLVGDGLRAYDLQMMVCRGFVLHGLSTRVVSLAYLDGLVSGQDDYAEIWQAQVIGIRGWCELGELGANALSSDRWHRVDMMLRVMLEHQKAFVLQSPNAPEQCNVWSKTLREFVADRTAPYEVK